MYDDYWFGLSKETDYVFKSHPDLFDHREQYSWLVGALGNPRSNIFFVAENPSLTQVERVGYPHGKPPTIETQWSGSRGDILFREMLVKHGFKNGSIDSPGGWDCYITNVIKEADYTKDWREKSQELRNHAAEIWARVLAYELSRVKPKLVVVMGKQTEALIRHLVSIEKIRLPRVEQMTHYVYIGQRAQGRLGPMHPERVKAYDQEFARIRKILEA